MNYAKKIFAISLAMLPLATAMGQGTETAQRVLSLDSCRAMALRSNKQLSASRVKTQVAKNVQKAARKAYLPHVDVAAGWELMSREISILNDEQKSMLGGLGSNTVAAMQGLSDNMSEVLTNLAMSGNITPTTAQAFGQLAEAAGGAMAQYGDALGQKVVDAFRTDNRSMFAASAVVNAPIYMGGAITAANRMADISVTMAEQSTDMVEQTMLYDIDNAYWTVVSLRHKQELADKYLQLVQKLNSDIHKMIDNGVATRADGLKVDVRVNEAEMTKTQVDNGLSLAKMYLCQLCGLDLNSNITLTDEQAETLTSTVVVPQYDKESAIETRPELQLLDSSVKLSESATKLARAAALPQVLATGGYLISNPNVYNGFENKFGGVWNVGLLLRVPVFDWGENMYKVRAAKLSTTMAKMELDEAREKINLQVQQCEFKLNEANKKLVTAQKNILRAEENLRCANVGFQEGVMQTTDVMAAQTAWLQAQTQHVDAEIDVRLAEAGMRKALGIK